MIENPKKLINEGLVSVLKTVIEKYMSRGPTARAKNGTGSLKLAPMHATIDGRELSNSHSRACRINANNTTATDTPASCNLCTRRNQLAAAESDTLKVTSYAQCGSACKWHPEHSIRVFKGIPRYKVTLYNIYDDPLLPLDFLPQFSLFWVCSECNCTCMTIFS
jgi:hypothetical protein